MPRLLLQHARHSGMTSIQDIKMQKQKGTPSAPSAPAPSGAQKGIHTNAAPAGMLPSGSAAVATADMEGVDPNEVYDEVDRAQHIMLQQQEEVQRRARAMFAPESHPDFDGLHCVEEDCGVVLPLERLKLHRIRCTSCQEDLDRKLESKRRNGYHE